MAGRIDAISLKRRMYFELDDTPYLCLDVEVSKPSARGGQTLVRLKMRNLLTRAVFDRTFKASDMFGEPDLAKRAATFLYTDGDAWHFMDQESFETLSLAPETIGDDRLLLTDSLPVLVHTYNGRPIGLEMPVIVELTVTDTEPAVRGDTASGGVTKSATLETGLEVRVPLFIRSGERVKVHSETRAFAGRA